MTLCECGCGGEVSPGKRFISGHNLKVNSPMKKGTKLSEESKQKQKETRRLNKLIKEGKMELPYCACGCGGRVTKLGNKYIAGHHCRGKPGPMKGKKAWNKGLTKESDERVKRIGENGSKTKKIFYTTEEGQKWLDENIRGVNNPLYGKKSWKKGLTKETDDSIKRRGEKLSKTKKEFYATEEGQQWLDNNNRGENHSKPMLGKYHTEAAKQRMSKTKSGENNPMFGRTGEDAPMYGIHHTKEVKQELSIINSGENNPMFGKTGENCPSYGRHPSDETRQKISDNHWDNSGENHPFYGKTGDKASNWQDGISFEPYCIKFNKEFKDRVRHYFNGCCYVCGIGQSELGRKLDVHHVNYDKMVCCNDVKPLFVSLCQSCHSKTLKDREYWEEFFTVSLEYLTQGECFLPKEEKISKK